MQHKITKLCADALRAFLNANYGIKLKSGHAHEITAAVFGYKSSIALHADRIYPLSRIEQAEFIMLLPAHQLLDERLRRLDVLRRRNGMPINLPSSELLIQSIYSAIADEPELTPKVQTNARDLAITLAKELVYSKMKMLGVKPEIFNWQLNVETQFEISEILMKVSFDYLAESGKRHRYGKMDVKLSRIAGNIGYGEPKFFPTFYSGRLQDPSFNPDFGSILTGQH